MHGVADPDTAQDARLPERHAGRVILLDPGDRVLLMRYDDELPNGRHWTTPGGGLNPGEDYAAAAVRELAEETGWTDVTLRHEVLQRSLTMEYGGRLVHQYERHYLARTQQRDRPVPLLRHGLHRPVLPVATPLLALSPGSAPQPRPSGSRPQAPRAR